MPPSKLIEDFRSRFCREHFRHELFMVQTQLKECGRQLQSLKTTENRLWRCLENWYNTLFQTLNTIVTELQELKSFFMSNVSEFFDDQVILSPCYQQFKGMCQALEVNLNHIGRNFADLDSSSMRVFMQECGLGKNHHAFNHEYQYIISWEEDLKSTLALQSMEMIDTGRELLFYERLLAICHEESGNEIVLQLNLLFEEILQESVSLMSNEMRSDLLSKLLNFIDSPHTLEMAIILDELCRVRRQYEDYSASADLAMMDHRRLTMMVDESDFTEFLTPEAKLELQCIAKTLAMIGNAMRCACGNLMGTIQLLTNTLDEEFMIEEILKLIMLHTHLQSLHLNDKMTISCDELLNIISIQLEK